VLLFVSALNARLGKFGVGMMILQAAKTGFSKNHAPISLARC
jgi:hypothetical protein